MPFGFPRKSDFPSFLCKWLPSLHLQDSLEISGFLHTITNKSLGLRMRVTKLAYAYPGSFNPDRKNLLSVQNKSALSLASVASAIRLLRKFNFRDIWVIDQVWGQDGWILASFFFCVFMDRNEVEVHKLAKKERGQYPAILTEQTWSVNELLPYMAF